jgi:hypothetical protein
VSRDTSYKATGLKFKWLMKTPEEKKKAIENLFKTIYPKKRKKK